MPKSAQFSDQLVSDAQVREEAKGKTTVEQIEYWAQLGEICEETPE